METNNKEMIGIVTVLYKSGPVLEDFFQSLNNQTFNNFRCYVIDNASPDNSVEVTKLLMKNVNFETILIEEQTNWGVAKGNNIGIKKALEDGCDYVLLSNNDILFDPNTIQILYDAISEENATMVVPKFYFWNTDKIIWCAGGYFSWLRGTSMHYGYKEKDNGQYDNRNVIEYCPTCFMLIKSAVFDRVGLMDEKYFVYSDDTDFCWRATRVGNEKMVYVPEALVVHKESYCAGGGTSDFGFYYMNRNWMYFALKNFSFIHRAYYYIYLFIHYIVRDFWHLSSERKKQKINALKDGWNLYYNKI